MNSCRIIRPVSRAVVCLLLFTHLLAVRSNAQEPGATNPTSTTPKLEATANQEAVTELKLSVAQVTELAARIDGQVIPPESAGFLRWRKVDPQNRLQFLSMTDQPINSSAVSRFVKLKGVKPGKAEVHLAFIRAGQDPLTTKIVVNVNKELDLQIPDLPRSLPVGNRALVTVNAMAPEGASTNLNSEIQVKSQSPNLLKLATDENSQELLEEASVSSGDKLALVALETGTARIHLTVAGVEQDFTVRITRGEIHFSVEKLILTPDEEATLRVTLDNLPLESRVNWNVGNSNFITVEQGASPTEFQVRGKSVGKTQVVFAVTNPNDAANPLAQKTMTVDVKEPVDGIDLDFPPGRKLLLNDETPIRVRLYQEGQVLSGQYNIEIVSKSDNLSVRRSTAEINTLLVTGLAEGPADMKLKVAGHEQEFGFVVATANDYYQVSLNYDIMDRVTAAQMFGKAIADNFIVAKIVMVNNYLDEGKPLNGNLIVFSNTLKAKVFMKKAHRERKSNGESEWSDLTASDMVRHTSAPYFPQGQPQARRGGVILPAMKPTSTVSSASSTTRTTSHTTTTADGSTTTTTTTTIGDAGTAPTWKINTNHDFGTDVVIPEGSSLVLDAWVTDIAGNPVLGATDKPAKITVHSQNERIAAVRSGSQNGPVTSNYINAQSLINSCSNGECEEKVIDIVLTAPNCLPKRLAVRVVKDTRPALVDIWPYAFDEMNLSSSARQSGTRRSKFMNALDAVGSLGSFLSLVNGSGSSKRWDAYGNLLIPSIKSLWRDNEQQQLQNVLTYAMKPIEQLPASTPGGYKVVFIPHNFKPKYLSGYDARVESIANEPMTVDVAVVKVQQAQVNGENNSSNSEEEKEATDTKSNP